MNDLQKERIDGAMVIGFQVDGDTYSTQICDKMPAQEVYHYLEPVAEYRSIDTPSQNYIVSWRPYRECYSRLREWRESGLNVPEDVRVSEDTLAVLASVSASERIVEETDGLELPIPPLSHNGLAYIKQEILTQHNIIATGGYGVEPLRLDADAREKIEEWQSQSITKPANES